MARVVADNQLGNRMRAERLTTEWTELVGARIAARTRPAGVVDRMLVIEVASSAWLHELSLLRLQLLTGLVERLGEPRLFDDLKLKLAGRDRPAPAVVPGTGSAPPPNTAAARRPKRPVKTPDTPATGAARERIVREAAAVDDAELRELIARVRIAHDK